MDFDAFFSQTYRRTVTSVYLVLGSMADAEDCAQEAYLRASRHWERISVYDAPEAWVRRVAYNLALNTLGRTKRRAASLIRLGQLNEPVVEHMPDIAVELHEALMALPMRYRAVIVLHYFLDLSVKEIAEELDIPAETVRTRLARGRRRLSAALDGLTPSRAFPAPRRAVSGGLLDETVDGTEAASDGEEASHGV